MEDASEYADRVTFSVPRRLARRLRSDASASGRTVSGIVREALDRYYADQEPIPLPSFTGIGRGGARDDSLRAREIVTEAILTKHRR